MRPENAPFEERDRKSRRMFSIKRPCRGNGIKLFPLAIYSAFFQNSSNASITGRRAFFSKGIGALLARFMRFSHKP